MKRPRRRAVELSLVALAICLAGAYWAAFHRASPSLAPERPGPDLPPASSGGAPGSSGEAPDSLALAAQVLRACAALPAAERLLCYQPRLVAAASRPDVAMGALNRLGELDPEAKRNGHVYAHAIGIASYRPRADPAEAFRLCTDGYQSGCYHGVIQGYFESVRRARGGEIGTAVVNEVCRPFRADTPDGWLLFTCVHGLGHGLTMFYGHDLPRALRGCDLLARAWDRESCYGGAFMENIVNALAPHHAAEPAESANGGHGAGASRAPAHSAHGAAKPAGSSFKALDPSDAHYPCSAVERRYLGACYMLQTSAILPQNGWDFAGAARTCDAAPQGFRAMCYRSLGRDASSYAGQDVARSLDLCGLGSPGLRAWCYAGVAKDIAYGPGRLERGLAFCGSVPEAPGKAACYEALGEDIALLEQRRPEQAALCEGAERAYVDACRYGARLTDRKPDNLPRPG